MRHGRQVEPPSQQPPDGATRGPEASIRSVHHAQAGDRHCSWSRWNSSAAR